MPEKTLIVYYSLTGNTKFIAEAIKEEIQAEILAIKPKKELDPESSSKFFWGGFQSTMKKKPNLEPFDINPLDYDFIIIGTPVWAWNFSPPIRSFIKNYDLQGKKVALWSCSKGGTEKALNQLEENLKNTNIVGRLSLIEPLNKDSEEAKQKAIEWSKKMVDMK
jgi:flavodoxin